MASDSAGETCQLPATQKASSLESALVAADASVDRSEAQLELTRSDSERAIKLLAGNATSEEDAARKERNVDLALASVAASKAARKQTELALESTIDGSPHNRRHEHSFRK